MMTVKEQLEQRLNDLRGFVESDRIKRGAYIETTAAKMVLDDLLLCAGIADMISAKPATVAEVMAINQLYQAYIGPAYSQLVNSGQIPPPPVLTNDAAIYKSKDQLD